MSLVLVSLGWLELWGLLSIFFERNSSAHRGADSLAPIMRKAVNCWMRRNDLGCNLILPLYSLCFNCCFSFDFASRPHFLVSSKLPHSYSQALPKFLKKF